jgi:hypothetical protein
MFFVLLTIVLLLILLLWIASAYKIDRSQSRSFVNWYPSITPPEKVPKVRIIVSTDGRGRHTDAQIYSRLIPGSRIVYTDRVSALTDKERYQQADINIWIEQFLPGVFPATKNWLVVNHQWLEYDLEKLRQIDLFLTKSEIAQTLLWRMIQMHNLPGKVRYVKLSSPDHSDKSVKKDWNLILHVGCTDQLIDTWIQNNGFAELDLTLAFTGTYRGIHTWKRSNKGYRYLESVPNLHWYDELTQDLRRRAGAYLFTSHVEDFTHTRNEARAVSSVIIAPMGNIRIRSDPVNSQKFTNWSNPIPFSEGYSFSNDDIAEAIRSYATRTDKEQIGQANRKQYEQDTRFFTLSIYDLLK